MANEKQLHIITLDVRSFKEPNSLPSLGGYTWIPYLSKFATGIRYLSSVFGKVVDAGSGMGSRFRVLMPA
jgi:phosphoglycerol transferase MdoB-like AlkP superfamily enzyme